MKTVRAMLTEAEAEVAHITPQEAKELFGGTEVLFLDVREPNEVAESGKVSGALSVPRGLIEFRADPSSAMHDAKLNRAKTVIVYCGSGGTRRAGRKDPQRNGLQRREEHGRLQRMGRCGRSDRKRMTVGEASTSAAYKRLPEAARRHLSR
jgi:rhodanese-related sulfurtransferase